MVNFNCKSCQQQADLQLLYLVLCGGCLYTAHYEIRFPLQLLLTDFFVKTIQMCLAAL